MTHKVSYSSVRSLVLLPTALTANPIAFTGTIITRTGSNKREAVVTAAPLKAIQIQMLQFKLRISCFVACIM